MKGHCHASAQQQNQLLSFPVYYSTLVATVAAAQVVENRLLLGGCCWWRGYRVEFDACNAHKNGARYKKRGRGNATAEGGQTTLKSDNRQTDTRLQAKPLQVLYTSIKI
jgi:hypothetical protein